MKQHLLRCAVALAVLLSCNMDAFAQFYTVSFVNLSDDTLSLSKDPFGFSDAKLVIDTPTKKSSQEKSKKIAEKSFSRHDKSKANSSQIHLKDTSDSLILELIKKRLTVCMPLDLVRINSAYGYRKDPFKKCQKFHDGIDLHGTNDMVFSMLPGRVEKVSFSNSGYGNHIILNHGNIRCLYGHLSSILVKEGEMVDAGTAVGHVGSTGKSTGNHLHCRIQRLHNGKWQSVDPVPLIEQLNSYMNELNRRIALLTGNTVISEVQQEELTISNLYKALKAEGIKFPKIVLAQALLESGHFRSQLTKTHNNIFGLRRKDGSYFMFSHWRECVVAYRDKVQYRHKNSENYYAFLKRIKYAGDPLYINKVKQIAESL